MNHADSRSLPPVQTASVAVLLLPRHAEAREPHPTPPELRVKAVVTVEAAWQTLLVDPTVREVLVAHDCPTEALTDLTDRLASARLRRLRQMPVVRLDKRGRRLLADGPALTEPPAGLPVLLTDLAVTPDLPTLDLALGEAPEPQRAAWPDSVPDTFAAPAVQAWAACHFSGDDLSLLALRCPFPGDGVPAGLEQTWRARFMAMLLRSVGQALRRGDRFVPLDSERLLILARSTTEAGAVALAIRLAAMLSTVPVHRTLPGYTGSCTAFLASFGVASMLTDRLVEVPECARRAIDRLSLADTQARGRIIGASTAFTIPFQPEGDEPAPDVSTALEWIRAGRSVHVIPHLRQLEESLAPLLRLLGRDIS